MQFTFTTLDASTVIGICVMSLFLVKYYKVMTLFQREGWGSGSMLARSANMGCDREIDGSNQLSSIYFDHVNNSHSN